jgi:hypothetical protein
MHNPPASTMNNCIASLSVGLQGLPVLFAPLELEVADFANFVACGVSATTCDEALACASRGHGADYCAAHPGYGCDGDFLVPCPPAGVAPDAALYTIDCAARGLRCITTDAGASCSDDVGCDPKAQPPACDGNRYFQLCDYQTHRRYRVDCARSPVANATCRNNGNGNIGCLPSGPPCNGARCDGDVLIRCIIGQEVPLDCAALASRCDVVSGHGPQCVPLADCPTGSIDACDGDSLTSCVYGVVGRADCTSIGLSTCVKAPGGQPICSL